ncbi:MAG TPA: hypothetical protein VGG30_09220, partial [Pirellulales bacterium]
MGKINFAHLRLMLFRKHASRIFLTARARSIMLKAQSNLSKFLDAHPLISSPGKCRPVHEGRPWTNSF